MGNIRKVFSLLLVAILAVSSLMLIKTAWAQSMPSVPEFSIKYEAHPYDVPTQYGTDEYTGKNITIQEGYHVYNQTVTLAIKNQVIISSSDGHNYYLYYNIRTKGHFGKDWVEFYSDPMHSLSPSAFSTDLPSGFLSPSDSKYTVVMRLVGYPARSQVDFQVEALMWQDTQVYIADHPMAPIDLGGHYEQRYSFYGTSGWSNTQTITIPETSTTTSPSPNPTPTPVVPEFPILASLPLFAAVWLLATRLLQRKRSS